MSNSSAKGKRISFITFLMNGGYYAVDVTKVTELLEMVPITSVPRAPEYLRGVINLHGDVVPVIDCRLKFSVLAAADTVETCIVVMSIATEGKLAKVGGIVDSVSEVIEIDESEILPLPSWGDYQSMESLSGIIKLNDHLVMVLDADKEFQKDVVALDQLQIAESAV